jgi:hypothetical protein
MFLSSQQVTLGTQEFYVFLCPRQVESMAYLRKKQLENSQLYVFVLAGLTTLNRPAPEAQTKYMNF